MCKVKRLFLESKVICVASHGSSGNFHAVIIFWSWWTPCLVLFAHHRWRIEEDGRVWELKTYDYTVHSHVCHIKRMVPDTFKVVAGIAKTNAGWGNPPTLSFSDHKGPTIPGIPWDLHSQKISQKISRYKACILQYAWDVQVASALTFVSTRKTLVIDNWIARRNQYQFVNSPEIKIVKCERLGKCE